MILMDMSSMEWIILEHSFC